jgi:hypothetical protein
VVYSLVMVMTVPDQRKHMLLKSPSPTKKSPLNSPTPMKIQMIRVKEFSS